ncbi:Crp/Fnr family transcriptional regulator [Ensifer sp. 4252]|uniref:Crp/Fnr family transcriptional regulator n=1 Tax=Ensifer sp. 4252 TaxID=3373915 RepID=UPI003D207943
MRNGLINTLSDEDRVLVQPLLERVKLDQADSLFEPFEPISHVYFFESGLSSEIVIGARTNQIEVGCIGHEGCSAVPVLLGIEATPHRAFMQAGGEALRIPTPKLWQAMDTSPTLRTVLLRYAHVFMIQVAETALANGRCGVEQRLARWLLMCQDRLGDELPLTHEFLSLMLGVRRPSVTDALHILEGHRAIRAERALIKVRDRAVLETTAGDAYGVPEKEYRRLLSPLLDTSKQ